MGVCQAVMQAEVCHGLANLGVQVQVQVQVHELKQRRGPGWQALVCNDQHCNRHIYKHNFFSLAVIDALSMATGCCSQICETVKSKGPGTKQFLQLRHGEQVMHAAQASGVTGQFSPTPAVPALQ